ncbi:hypothetical protein BGZ98_000533 [Dissophora globulifera]|nr:hypothetical protein BGZ98_000533 [Dissophora globulifera]
MATASISTLSPDAKYSLVSSATPTLFLSAKSKAQTSTATPSATTSSSMAEQPSSSSALPSAPASTSDQTAATEAPSTSSCGASSAAVLGAVAATLTTTLMTTALNIADNNNSSSNAAVGVSNATTATSVLQKSIVQQRRQPLGAPLRLTLQQHRHSQYPQPRSSYGSGHPLTQQIQGHTRSSSSQAGYYHLLSPRISRRQTVQLASKLEDAMSSPLLKGQLMGGAASSMEISSQRKGKHGDIPEEREEEQQQASQPCCSDYVYTAPCEHHPSKGQTEYLVNDMFPKLEHDLSTIEFGIRISDFMPLAFKTVPVAGLAERELGLLNGLGHLPNVIQLEDSFVNDNGDTVLVLPMLRRFDCHAVNKNICSVRKAMRQILTGLAAVHAKNIVHLDINPSNLMMTHHKRDMVIIDFGLSMTVRREKDGSFPEQQIPVCGTTGYIAPEVIHPQFYGQHFDPTAADLYSLGIVLGEMLEPYIPDCDLHYFGSKYLGIENTNQTVNALKEFIAQDKAYPRVLIQAAGLLKNMLEENPKDRKSAQELLDTDPFLSVNPRTGAGATLELCDWMFRVQEIKYQRFMCQEQNGCEVYRYR